MGELNECEHNDVDKHNQCLDCGEDRTDDLVAEAEFRADCLEDR